MSPVKIVKNPEGSLQRAAMTQSALAKERRELQQQQQRTLLEAIPRDLSRPWEDPMPEDGERHLAMELRGLGMAGVGGYQEPEWKTKALGALLLLLLFLLLGLLCCVRCVLSAVVLRCCASSPSHAAAHVCLRSLSHNNTTQHNTTPLLTTKTRQGADVWHQGQPQHQGAAREPADLQAARRARQRDRRQPGVCVLRVLCVLCVWGGGGLQAAVCLC